MNLSLSSNTYYFSPSKDTTLRNGEQLTKYDHFDDDQTYLANKLEAPQQIATQPSLLEIPQTTYPQQPDNAKRDGQSIHHYICTCSTNLVSKPSFFLNYQFVPHCMCNSLSLSLSLSLILALPLVCQFLRELQGFAYLSTLKKFSICFPLLNLYFV